MRLYREALLAFLKKVEARLEQPAHLYLVGEERARPGRAREWTDQPFVYTAAAQDLERLRGPSNTRRRARPRALAEAPSDCRADAGRPRLAGASREGWTSEH